MKSKSIQPKIGETDFSFKKEKISFRRRFHSLLERGIFYAALVLLVSAAIPYGTVDPFWDSFFQSAVFILGALWAIEGSLCGDWLVPAHWRLLPPMLAFVVLAIFQTLPLWETEQFGITISQTISADPFETRKAIFKLLAFALFGAILLRYTNTFYRFRALIFVILGIAVASALFGVFMQMTGNAGQGFFQRLNRERSFAQFINKNHFPFLMEMGLGLAFGLIAGKGFRQRGRIIYLAIALLLSLSVALAASRGGIVALLCQVVLIGLLFPSITSPKAETKENRFSKSSSKSRGFSVLARLGLVACLASVVLIGVIWIGGDNLTDTLNRKPGEFDNTVKDSSRINIWAITWQLIKEHPVAGVGFGGYWIAITEYDDISGSRQIHYAHNEYFDLLAAGGLIGLGIFIWLVVAFVKETRQRLRQAADFQRAVIVGSWIGLLGVAAHSTVDFGLHATANAAVFIALISLATAELPYFEKIKTDPDWLYQK